MTRLFLTENPFVCLFGEGGALALVPSLLKPVFKTKKKRDCHDRHDRAADLEDHAAGIR